VPTALDNGQRSPRTLDTPFVAWLLAAALVAGCGGHDSASAERPCIVSEEKMATIWDLSEMTAHPQSNGLDCLYAADEEAVVMLGVRTPKQFEAERARFEDQGILLPPLEPTDGFGGKATVDPRYNSLNVIAGDTVVSVQLLDAEPSDPAEQLALEKRIAQAAVDELG
jgi:hypothetical protein